MFADSAVSDDKFLDGRVRLWQPTKGYRAATDPVFLAASVFAHPAETVLELGCGVGAASLCLGARLPGLLQAGLELQPDYAELARRNAVRNQIALEVVQGDLAQMPAALRRGFDHVMANPPYYARGGTPSPLPGRDRAMRVEATPIACWVQVAARRLKPGGWMSLIIGADCLPEALGAMDKMGSAAVLPLVARHGRAAGRVILRARKGGRGAFRLLAPFVLHQGVAHDGDRENYTAETRAILRDGGDLSAQFS